MTRINAGIEVVELCDAHLLAEHRELPRIPNTIKSGKANLNIQPLKFKLGSNHVKFFYPRLKYLKNRYKSIYNECIKRGFNVQDYSDSFSGIDFRLFGDWNDKYARKILVPRINERLETMKNIKYYSQNINKELAKLTL